MTIEYINEQAGSFNYGSSGYTYLRKFLYLLKPGDFPDDISSDSNLPKPNEAHPRHADYIVTSIGDPTIGEGFETSGDGSWVVEVTYTKSSTADDPTGEIFPWNLPPYGISYDTKTVVEAQDKAYQDGDTQFNPTKPVVHPITKEPILPQKDVSHGIIKFSYNLRNFDYSWKQEFEGTINSEGVTILNISFEEKFLVLQSISATLEQTTMASGNEVEYYAVTVEIEDLRKEYDKLVALRGFMMKAGSGVANIQLQKGVYGNFDQTKRDLDIGSMVYVSSAGSPAQTSTHIDDNYYASFPAKFPKSWGALNLPSTI